MRPAFENDLSPFFALDHLFALDLTNLLMNQLCMLLGIIVLSENPEEVKKYESLSSRLNPVGISQTQCHPTSRVHIIKTALGSSLKLPILTSPKLITLAGDKYPTCTKPHA
jgi:hypothetical protein